VIYIAPYLTLTMRASSVRGKRLTWVRLTDGATPKAHTYCFLSWLYVGLPEPITCTLAGSFTCQQWDDMGVSGTPSRVRTQVHSVDKKSTASCGTRTLSLSLHSDTDPLQRQRPNGQVPLQNTYL